MTRQNGVSWRGGCSVPASGAALARLELRIGYLALLRRFPGLRLAIPRDELRFRSYAPNYNVETLPVAW